MTKRTKLLIGLALVCLGIGGVIMEFTLNDGMGIIVTEKESQIAYLKEHEQEIIGYVKSQNAKIESVQIDWNDVRTGNVSNPFSDEKYVSLYGTFNNIENSGWTVTIYTVNGKLDISTIALSQYLMIGVEPFE